MGNRYQALNTGDQVSAEHRGYSWCGMVSANSSGTMSEFKIAGNQAYNTVKLCVCVCVRVRNEVVCTLTLTENRVTVLPLLKKR